eukprot:scaffold8134_cov138-Isochrysis_galbana.AAC.2
MAEVPSPAARISSSAQPRLRSSVNKAVGRSNGKNHACVSLDMPAASSISKAQNGLRKSPSPSGMTGTPSE